MRFAHSIRLNSNPRWWSYHIPYEQLKSRLKRLRQLHAAKYYSSSPSSSESAVINPLSTSSHQSDSPDEHEHAPLPANVASSRSTEDGGATRTRRTSTEYDDDDDDNNGQYGQSDDSSDEEQEEEQEDDDDDTQRNERVPLRPSSNGFNVGRGLTRTASDAVISSLAENPQHPVTWAIPSRVDHKIVLPVLESYSRVAAERLLEEEDALFFQQLRSSTRVADDFYVRMVNELRNFVNDRKRAADSCLASRVQVPSISVSFLHQSTSDLRVDESSQLLPVTQDNVNGTAHSRQPQQQQGQSQQYFLSQQQQQQQLHPSNGHSSSSTNHSYHSSPSPLFHSALRPPLPKPRNSHQGSVMHSKIVWDHKKEHDLRCDFVYLYREMHNTRNFAILNVTSIEKILKKHDKMLGTSTKSNFMKHVLETTSLHKADDLISMMNDIVSMYALLFLDGDESRAVKQLCYDLPDQVFWTRGTYWGDCTKEKLKSAEMHKARALPAPESDVTRVKRADSNVVSIAPSTPVKPVVLTVGILLFIIISLCPSIVRVVVGREVVAQYPDAVINAANRALAMLALAVVFWAGKAIPLFATAFVVMAVATSMGVFINPETQLPLDGHDASAIVVQHIGSPTILLILCVYAFASAMKKCQIDRVVAAALLKRLNPTGPSLVAWLMTLSIFVSLLVSNVASPVLMISVMKDTLMALNRGERNRRFVKCLLFAIMVSCNVGGFVSPIASPQAAVAIGVLSASESTKIDFAQWIFVMVPLAAFMLMIVYIFLLRFYFKGDVKFPLPEPPKVKFTWSHWGTVVILTMTVAMWLLPYFSTLLGNTGVIATIPLFFIFGSGILSKSDFNHLAWDIVMLIAGGSVLGAAVKSSHLLDMFAKRLMQHAGSTAAISFLLLCVTTTIISVFVSHTVCSIILLPLFMRIGQQFDQAQLFVLGGTVAASVAMVTNVASFPNLTISELHDDKGDSYLSTKELSVCGFWMTTVCLFLLTALGCSYLYLAA